MVSTTSAPGREPFTEIVPPPGAAAGTGNPSGTPGAADPLPDEIRVPVPACRDQDIRVTSAPCPRAAPRDMLRCREPVWYSRGLDPSGRDPGPGTGTPGRAHSRHAVPDPCDALPSGWKWSCP